MKRNHCVLCLFSGPVNTQDTGLFDVSQCNWVSSAREDVVCSLAYPLEVGTRWISYTEPGGQWHNDKEVTALVTRTVPAGTFECYEIRWHVLVDARNETSADLDWVDYYAREGLVERIVTSRSVEKLERDESRLIETVAHYRLTGFSLR